MNDNNSNSKDLDDLKSIWQSQTEEKSYDSAEIFKMIHRKSINSVQWLFIITLIEFLSGIGMSLWMLFSGNHLYSKETIEIVGQNDYLKLENLSHLGLIGSIVIMFITYYYYKKISSTMAVQELISCIIKFRKTVILFIIFWLIFVFIIFIPIMIDLGMNTYLNENVKADIKIEDAKVIAKKVGYLTAAITAGLILIFSLLYYGLIYGTFLRRLGRNLKELKNIKN